MTTQNHRKFVWSLAGLFYLTHHTHLTLRIPIIIFLKPAEFYAKGIEELSDKWQHVIANDGEYIMD